MKTNKSVKPLIIRKMEQLYQIKFDNVVFICAVDRSYYTNEYQLLSGNFVLREAKDEISLSFTKFNSIEDVLHCTNSGESSDSELLTMLDSTEVLTPVLSFKTLYEQKYYYIDVQGLLFREMFEYTENIILCDSDLKNTLEKQRKFHEHIIFIEGWKRRKPELKYFT